MVEPAFVASWMLQVSQVDYQDRPSNSLCSMDVCWAVMEQQRIADLEQQLHHAESVALAAETRAARLGARQNEARAIDWASFDGQNSDTSSRRIAAPWMLT